MRILHHLHPYVTISLSVLVLLICIPATAGLWIVQGRVASTAVSLLGALDRSAQALRNGVNRVDAGLAKLGDTIETVEDASAQLAQNVNDSGLILTLLPPTKEQELTTAAQSVQEDFVAIQAFLDTATEMLQAFDNLPFINPPGMSLAAIEELQNKMDQIATLVDALKADIAEFRSGIAERISRITLATTQLNNQLDGLRSDLAHVDAELNTIQDQSRQLQDTLPRLLLLGTILLTLVATWIVYSEIVMINLAVNRLRETSNHEATDEPDDIAEESLTNVNS